MTLEHTEEGRSARKRRMIMEAATTLFLRNGYQGTSMDEIATLAAASKQTLYKHFADKEALFSAIVLGVAGTVESFLERIATTLAEPKHLYADLQDIARHYIKTVMQPQVLQMRRLLIGESARFPELTREYYEKAPERVLAALAPELKDLDKRGLLKVDDPVLAAKHFAFLILGTPLDKAMFYGDEIGYSEEELMRLADEGVKAFLRAYRADPS
ncbi:TetR/AcrR family transcriptional regulator [Actinocrispum sp. NPDC049592]|uniref:TetR/AcrR family transcriptional regulator n=1 Tax=Actinocrispum sp. NPDC049592 TaxID=3154835 RepID=UPI003429736D